MDFVNVNDQLTNIAQVARRCPGPTLRRAYTRALREWCQQTQWLRLSLPGQTVVNVPVYNMGNDVNLDIVGLRAVSLTQVIGTHSQTYGLDASDSSTWNGNLPPGLPRRYQYVPEGKVALDPAPDKVYTFVMSMILIPKESMAVDAQVPAAPLVKYSNDIESGALAYLLAIPGQPWSNPSMAAQYARDFKAAISNGKAEVQRAYNTGSMRVRPNPFVPAGRVL